MLFEHEKYVFFITKKTLTQRFENDARGDRKLLFFVWPKGENLEKGGRDWGLDHHFKIPIVIRDHARK